MNRSLHQKQEAIEIQRLIGDVRQQEREAIVAWLEKQCADLKRPLADHVMAGGSLDDRNYRLMLGQHQAYMRARSFMHGHLTHQESK